MNGRAWKKWYKTKPRPSRDDIRDVKSQLRWYKHADRALMFAKRVLREIKKADAGGSDSCGFWYDINDGGGYRELCLAGGRCDARCSDNCPKALAERLVRSLSGGE